MSIRSKKRKSQTIKHPCEDLAAIWGIRILLNLNGWKKLKESYRPFTGDGNIMSTIGLGHLVDDEMDGKTFVARLGEQQDCLEQAPVKTCPHYRANLKRLKKLLGLTKTEIELINFAVTLHTHSGLDDTADTLDNITLRALIQALSCILDISNKKIEKALAHNGLLARTGLLRISLDKMERMKGRLNLMDGLDNVLFSSQNDSILKQFFHTGPRATLCPDDYQYIQMDYQLIKRYLQNGLKQKSKGINILLHGVPGTGKTELARTLSQDLGAELFEISFTDLYGDAMNGKGRFTAYQLSQQVLSQHQNALIVFDEIEDVFPACESIFGKIYSEEKYKAWVNQQLEVNNVPAIWISNDIEQIDNAYIRRFDYVLEMEAPPRKVRAEMLEKQLSHLPVTKRWIDQAAGNQHLVPALISRAAKVVTAIHDKKESTERALEQILGNSLSAMGVSERINASQPSASTTYCLEAVNPDYDIAQLLDGLKQHPQGRLCLYGPPGTGKTEFGRYLARQLDKPLLVKRASDILDAYLGNTEKQIARMFKQARNDQSVLLLDEADSFLQDRSGAMHSWEITRVNELLTQMEEFEGLFVCSTNLMNSLDAACLRRFDVKIKFDYLLPKQSWQLFKQILLDMDVPVKNSKHWQDKLARLDCLTPGDFATVVRQNRLKNGKMDADTLINGLCAENSFKQQNQSRGIGFTAEI